MKPTHAMTPYSLKMFLTVALTLCGTLASGCKWGARAPEAVATVNGEAITKLQFDATMARNLKRYSAQNKELPPTMMARVQESVLRRMAEDVAVAQRAKSEGVTLSDTEIQEQFEAHRQRFRDDDAFADYLARANITEDSLKDELGKSLLRDRVIAKLGGMPIVSDEEVRNEYEQHPEQYTEPEQMQVRRLVIAVPADASVAKRRQLRLQAHQLAAWGRARPQGFAELCRKHSSGPEASQGGDMGLVLSGRLPELDRLVAQGLQENIVSGVVDGGTSLTLYQMTHHRPKRLRPLAEVEISIRTSLQLRRQTVRRQEIMQQVMSDADVKIHVAFGAPSATAPRLDGTRTPATTPLTPPDAPPVRAPGSKDAGNEAAPEPTADVPSPTLTR